MKQKYLRNLFFFLVLSITALLAEPSVYGFNNSNNGSTSSQNMMIQNKRTIAALKRQISEQNERIDGLTSLIEGLNATMGELQERGIGTSSMGTGNDNTALLKELGAMIDNINDNYVSKEELKKILNSKGKYTPSSKEKTTISEETLEDKPTSKLYSEGVRLFVKKRYSEAKKRFTITDIKGYKPAASNYYLGEIAYYTKKYEDAIFYFKKSAGLYDQASYIDVLLLHTAISLEKSGDKAQARAFYENIVENYQGKKSAKIAKEKLKKL
ncbi:tetratricopeptide repeat protein [Sulfurovum sp. CS9]|uniref:tetratricopeptide repeat protein n=1 Tax=Sulfurovum sp. CS9 TaxID=3391146 RepID=UPI0039EB7E8A